MKNLHRLLKELFLLQRFQIHALMLLLMFSLTSCFQKYYKTNTVATTDSATLKKLVDEKKTFVVHCPDGAFTVKNISVGTDDLSGERDVLNPVTEKYLNPVPNDPNHLSMKQSQFVLNEVHLYTTISFPASGKVNLDINHIYRIDVYEFDKKATRQSRTLGIVGITVGAGAIVGLAVIAATSFETGMSNIALNLH
jgi:hypothetical protein